MARSVAEWVGRTDDTPVPLRVRVRVWEASGRRCAGCGRPLGSEEAKVCDHVLALINGGENREANLQTLGAKCCNPAKTAADVAVKARTARRTGKGFRRAKRPLPGGRDSGIKIKINGGPVDRVTGLPLRRRG